VGGNCALPVCLKQGEKEGLMRAASEERKEGRVWGDKWWMAKVEGTGRCQHIHQHP